MYTLETDIVNEMLQTETKFNVATTIRLMHFQRLDQITKVFLLKKRKN